MNNGEQPAFPITDGDSVATGVSKREYFAGLAMQAWLSSYPATEVCQADLAARKAVEYDDALLAELSKPQQ